MRVGRTYTSHLNLETKQHELLGMDLGEGVPRRALVMGLVLYLVWAGPLLLLFGFPSKVTFTFYFLPPLLTVVYGTQKSRVVDRRWNVTRWSIGARYLVLGHRPIISGGRRAATRGEWISRRARWSGRTELLLESPLGGLLERWLGAEEAVPVGAGAPIRLAARPRLYGPDAVARAHGRKALQHQEGTTS
ncbi:MULTISPECIES: hypothetical protein [Streptomyces]|uniref:hypothetical protein n=1 Tax=Streptomyces TaxID=1883 RepID=UPI0004C9AA26|nr:MULTISPECIES: hypothetical protein [unclassified Streptomyces]KJY23085.1 hypothetical protein VR43_03205 [Streptomyces sp. NRRL S-104]